MIAIGVTFITVQDYLGLIQIFILLLALVSLRHTKRAMRTNAITLLSQRMFEINKLEYKNPKLFDALSDDIYYDKSQPGYDPLLEKQMRHYQFMLFSFYEQLYYMRSDYRDEMMMVWNSRLRSHILYRKYFRKYWNTVFKYECTASFRNFVEKNLLSGDHMEVPHSICEYISLRMKRCFR